MTENLIPIISLSAIAFILGVVILIISKKFHVQTDPLVDSINKILPGVNCGACGYAGCSNFVEALVKTRDTSKVCPVGGKALSEQIGNLLGIKMADIKPVVVAVLCQGNNEKAKLTAEYRGIADCWAISQAYTGPKKCPNSCIGFGSCIPACKYGALKLEKGLIKVIEERCVGCGACVKKCPRNVLVMQGKKEKRYFVACQSADKGAMTRQYCSIGCIACTLCVKSCKFDAIKIENNLAVIDQNKCVSCEACIKVCPTKCITLHQDKVPAKTQSL